MLSLRNWTIRDNDGILKIDGGRVSWYKADRTDVRYLGKQHLTNGEFLHSFVVCIIDGGVEDDFNRGFIRLWEIREDWENRAWVYARKNGGGWTIHFEQISNQENVTAFHGCYQLRFKNRYIVKISHKMSSYRLQVNDHNSLLVEDSKELKGVPPEYECIWLASTIKSRRNNGNWSSGYIESLKLDQ